MAKITEGNVVIFLAMLLLFIWIMGAVFFIFIKNEIAITRYPFATPTQLTYQTGKAKVGKFKVHGKSTTYSHLYIHSNHSLLPYRCLFDDCLISLDELNEKPLEFAWYQSDKDDGERILYALKIGNQVIFDYQTMINHAKKRQQQAKYYIVIWSVLVVIGLIGFYITFINLKKQIKT